MRDSRSCPKAVILFLAAVWLGGCRAAPESEAPVEELRVEGAVPDTLELPRAELERARQVATALGADLAGLVFSTLEEEGAVAAIRVCSEIAQERTAAHATDGAYVRRVSDRLRNPRNEPDAAERLELDRFRSLEAEGRLPAEVVRIVRTGDERTLHLLRPVRIQPACLACHGATEEIEPDVRRIIAERYPDDRAVGYGAGDLRGAISVRIPIHHPN
jgi:hypothetical protein